MTRHQSATVADVEVVTHGRVRPEVVEYARQKIAHLQRYGRGPIAHVRIKLVQSDDPAVTRPAQAQANLDIDGRMLRAQLAAATLYEAVDLLQERLRNRLSRMALHWEARRGGMPVPEPGEWRRSSEPSQRPEYFPRPVEEREIVRHKAFELARATPDEAVYDMEQLDYDFHLFTDDRTGLDAVVYRAGPTGYRLARVTPADTPEPTTVVPLTVSTRPVPRLTEGAAVERLNATGQPFLFYADEATGRGRLLYHRYDGHYGLIAPAG